MKNLASILLAGTLLLAGLSGCKQTPQSNESKAETLISAKTLGLAYLEENKLEEAEAEFQKIIDLSPDDVMGYANLGVVYLRMGSFGDAETQLRKAIKLQPEDPDVRLILAKVFEMSGQGDKAVTELEAILAQNPGHVKSLYNLTELYASSTAPDAGEKRFQTMEQLAEGVPGNIVPRLNLTDMLLQRDRADAALAQLEEIQQIAPGFPKEAEEYFRQAVAALKSGDCKAASTPFMIFHNYMKVTTPYQSGMTDLKGPGGSLVGTPVITFDEQQLGFQAADWETVLAAIKFTDITSTAGLEALGTPVSDPSRQASTYLVTADLDGDGDVDLVAGKYDEGTGQFRHSLLTNDWGVYTDHAETAGLTYTGPDHGAEVSDLNNDGRLDVFVAREGNSLLFVQGEDGRFADASKGSGLDGGNPANVIRSFDYDHDGDLDLFLGMQGANRLYRYNGDGTYTEMAAEAGLAGGNLNTVDACFADFDEDGDVDLFVVNADGPNVLYSNQRQGKFSDITADVGLGKMKGSNAVTLGDCNNDGFQDLFVASSGVGGSVLYRNRGDGSFEADTQSDEIPLKLNAIRVHDADFIDFDNDGYLDLLAVGESPDGGPAAFLYHGDGQGKLWLAPGNLPADLRSGRKIAQFDYNDDGDLDLVITGLDGAIRMLRNDGGNNHHFIKMKLVGLRAGSAKNNYYGIGAKVEMRSGSLYQSKVVTGTTVHFGLGSREKAEVIRILWTNGVPQNMFFPATDQDLIEEQQLKGSCPFLYAWDGDSYEFVKDVMWKSALGMPLGIMGENATYAPAGASVDYIRIPGEALQPQDGQYKIQITGELWETLYMDKFRLVAVDHPSTVDVYVDERMGGPTFEYELHQVADRHLPVSVLDQDGTDWLDAVRERDDRYTAGFHYGPFQGVTENSHLTLDLGKLPEDERVRLFLYGWIFPSDASINASLAQSGHLAMSAPVLEVTDGKGGWRMVSTLGFPMGKDKMLVADLSGRLNRADPRVRITTNMQLHWDQIFFTLGDPGVPVQDHVLAPVAADLHYRGFSRTYRKGGRYGPHWFDYSEVEQLPRWRDLTGNYTRYGDVTELLQEADDMYIIQNAGDEVTITFDASSLPALREGWKRDFLLHSVGWVKDGDLNTAHGQTVEPLPFHGMSAYPYGSGESYPTDAKHRTYREKYNTRTVDGKDFVRALSDPETQSVSR
ncbi:MAG: FG-GAP-like repeat-containing protein [Bacteroidales bacterium]